MLTTPEKLINEARRRKLIALDLTGYMLTDLPPEIIQLTNLTTLNLSSNRLSILPPEITQLTNLTTLNLSSNRLSILPPEITQLTNLTTLNLSSNQLTFIPYEITQLTNLTTLNLSSNQLRLLPLDIKNLKSLITLDLSSNFLTFLPKEIENLKNIISLDLSDNHLASLPFEIEELTKLQSLFLSSNKLKILPPGIIKLKNLIALDLSSNQLGLLPPKIKVFKKLQKLYLPFNELTFLPPEIIELGLEIKWTMKQGTNGIFLEGNPIESPPIEIVEKGNEAIIDYFRSLEGEKYPLNEAKVLLVGDGGSGKTSLVKCILRQGFDEKEPETPGIDIKWWEIQDGETTIKINIWDFGGQEIMHATHQFFLSKRSLYILVLDGRKDEKTEYWLKHIESFGGDSPILVVINKIDENPGFEVNRSFLLEKYKGIKGFYRVSCRTSEGIDFLRESLSDELTKVELRRVPFAKSWTNVKEKLKNLSDPFIGYKQYEDMCIKENILEKSARETLLGFLHDLGVILHFKDISLLHTYVLEPEWVTTAVYKIINSKKLAESRGILKLDSLDEILKQETEDNFYYPPDKYEYIVYLMKKFELCYDLEKNNTVLIPDLLEVEKPKFNFNYMRSLKFIIKYDFLPKIVMPRFIVKMHKDIKTELKWRTGVVLEDKALNSNAVVIADEEDRKIFIYVDGEQKKEYFSVIRKTLRDINESFEKIDAKELVPLPDNNEITIPYEDLIGYESMGKDEYVVGRLRKSYSVKKLLQGIDKDEKPIRKIEAAIYTEAMQMGDNYFANQAVVQGPGTNIQEMNFNQIWNEAKNEINLTALSNELVELRKKLIDEATSPEHYTSISEVCFAENCAKTGKGPKAFEHLSKAGTWALDVATKIGVPVAIEALKKALGL